MRFVEHNAVREACPAPQDVQRWQHGTNVFELLVVRPVREVDHDAAIRIPECAEQFPRCGRGILTSEYCDARQAFQRAIVAFRIDDADAVTVQDQLLAKQTSDP
jgi:hypothetical protein